MDLLQSFQEYWRKTPPFNRLRADNCRLVLAVSGGADSVALTDLLATCGMDMLIAHCNFQLRGDESEGDEAFVRSLAESYGRPVLVKRFDTAAYAARHKQSIQEAARELRYQWFAAIVSEQDKDSYVLTAHHADDAIETALMHFFRGTGIQGLTGMAASQPDRRLLRPLLLFRKQQLLDHLAARSLKFVEDSSNASDQYTRNFFRNRLIPQIRELFPHVDENILHTMDNLAGAAAIYRQAVDEKLAKLLEQQEDEWHIPVLKWKKTVPLTTITWEIIKPYGFAATQVPEVIRLLDADNGSYMASATHRIIRNRNWMILTPLATDNAMHIVVEAGESRVDFGAGSLLFSHTNDAAIKETGASYALLDAGLIKFPLLLRKWKQGDYFYPLGMQKKKKLSRFLIDLKLSRTDKEKLWVLEMDKKILWVIGHRIDDRFKLTEKTSEVLQVRYLK